MHQGHGQKKTKVRFLQVEWPATLIWIILTRALWQRCANLAMVDYVVPLVWNCWFGDVILLLTTMTSVRFITSSFFAQSYAFPGLVPVTSHQHWRNWLRQHAESLALAAVVFLRAIAALPAGFRSCGLSHCVLSGDAASSHAPSLRSPGPVCACERECAAAAACWDAVWTSDPAEAVCVQGDPSCRRSALLKDDSLLDFYYQDTRTYYDMFQRGLRIAGSFNHNRLDSSGDPCKHNWPLTFKYALTWPMTLGRVYSFYTLSIIRPLLSCVL